MIEGNQHEPQHKLERDSRLDLVKSISISLILFWHLTPIIISAKETSHTLIKIIDLALDQLYFSTLVAVPLFILTSLFLLFQKLQTSGYQYVPKRCKRLLELFIFWSTFQFLIYYAIVLIKPIREIILHQWQIPTLQFDRLLTGTQPSLPIVSDSVFYFLLVLLELTIISCFFLYWKDRQLGKFPIYVCTAIVIASLIHFEISNISGQDVPFWRLDNFLIYIPIAYFLNKREGKVAGKHILILYALFLLFGLQDTFLRSFYRSIGAYSRISVVCGTLAIFSSCLGLKNWKNSRGTRFLSKFSLGIFAIHKYWQLVVTVLVFRIFQRLNLPTEVLMIDTAAICVALATTFLTFASVLLLNRTPFQKLIK